MEQTANNWPNGFELNLEDMSMNHMTVNSAEMSTDFPAMNGDAFSGVHPSLRYLPNLDVLQSDFPLTTLAEPNLDMRGQDIGMLTMPPFESSSDDLLMNGPIGRSNYSPCI